MSTHVLPYLISDVNFGYKRSMTASADDSRNGYSSVSSYSASSANLFYGSDAAGRKSQAEISTSESSDRSHFPSTLISTNVSRITLNGHDNSINSSATDFNSSNNSINGTPVNITEESSTPWYGNSTTTLSGNNYSYPQAGAFTLDSENYTTTIHGGQYQNGSTANFDNPTSTYIMDGVEILIICKYTVDVIHQGATSPGTRE